MGLTVSVVDSMVEGNKRSVVADITFDSSYLTGGEAIDPASLGLSSILYASAGSKGANMIQYDHTNKKLMAYVSSTGVQVANTVDLSATSIRMRFVGQ